MKKLFFFLAALCSQFIYAQRTVIYCGKMIDVKSSQVLSEMSIIVEENKITDLQKGYIATTANDKVIDLKNKTVMPGLIDCHVHVESETSPHNFTDQFKLNPADYAFLSIGYMEKTLMAGFTTVRDLGRKRRGYFFA
jgi:imidazolonepropionase-like amidohydrolase